MALTGCFWPSLDFHVVRGVPSPPLLQRLVLFDDAVTGTIPGTTPPAHVEVGLRANFQPEGPQAAGTISGHGVSIDTGTGVVTVTAPPSGGRRLHNFLLTASATDRNTHQAFSHVMRVHVHDSLTDAWLTPSALSLRMNRPDVAQFRDSRFSLLARFDDGVIGDIGSWAPLQWSTDPPSAVLPDVSDVQIVDAETGGVIARRVGARAILTVEYPPLGLSRHAEVTCTEEWGSPRDLTWVAGRDHAKWREVTNVLFLADGFTHEEGNLFLTLVRTITRKLRTPALRPFDILQDNMNYWVAFVRSDEPGFSIHWEVYTVEDPAGLAALPVPPARAPAAAAESWGVEELLHEVGLPVKADAARDLDGADGLLAGWQRVYGPRVTRPRVERSWQGWRALTTRTLINDRNTAFAATLASRPRVEGASDTLDIPWDRVHAGSINDLLAGLTYRGEPVGETWCDASGTMPRGKDYGLVCILVRTRTGRPMNRGDLYTASLARAAGHVVRPAPAGGFDMVPVRIKRHDEEMPEAEKEFPFVDVDAPPIDVVWTVAHETGHSLRLGDEYGERASPEYLTMPSGLSTADSANVQEHQSAVSPTSGMLDGRRVKWGGWHRIEKAGVLAADPDPHDVAARDFRLTLLPGHARTFKENDLVRLRRRPIVPDTLVSHVLRVKSTPVGNQAHLDVTVLYEGWTSPAYFRAGSVLMKMMRWPFRGLGTNLGEELMLMAAIIREHISTKGLPLNAPPGRALDACGLDDSNEQAVKNLPGGLPKCRPRNKNRIVGLFEGGSRYHCHVYHPTGVCIMRASWSGEDLLPFCPVCRYVLVDLIDPTKHGVVDQEYGRIYPDPRW
jgi:hypothetical protein